MNNFWKG